jgi:methionyl-tRNA synthetase
VRTLVTAGPPTSNGDLHLGHLSGPYAAGDIYTRYLRMLRRDVCYFSAADDHQSYVALKAAQTGRAPHDVADEYGQVIRDSLQKADVVMDFFGHPSRSRRYVQFLQNFVATLYAKGALIERTDQIPYCDTCDRLLFEAHIKGHCDFCGASSDGGICEACGHPNKGSDLNDARCATCNRSPDANVRKPVKRLLFPLNHYKGYLRRYAETAVMNPHARALCDVLLAMELPDVAVTQPATWGIPVPMPGYETQRISAWFELGPHYLAVADMLHESGKGPDWRELWTGDAEIIQCFGFDSAYFHIVLFPALFFAYDPAIKPPKGFIINEFYRLDGRKFSTSRKHALWASEFLEQYPSDAVRFHLCLTRPESEQTNFTLPEFLQTLDGELVAVWDAWLKSLAARANGLSAPRAETWRQPQLRFHERLGSIIRDVGLSYDLEGFSPRQAVQQLKALVREAAEFAAANAYYADNAVRQDVHRTNIALELAAARTLALLSWPIMPQFAARLWADLGHTTLLEHAGWETAPRLLSVDMRPNISTVGYFSSSSRREGEVLAA